MNPIPMPEDVARLVGRYAEKIENRNLLLNKFVLPKKWGYEEKKRDEASRWSLLRVADGGGSLLRTEAHRKRQRAGGPNVDPENREALQEESRLLDALSHTQSETKDAQDLRTRHSRRLRELLLGAHPEDSFCLILQLESRLAINLAEGVIENAGISLDRLFGLPFIPGSAVKGTARHAALEEIHTAETSARKALLEKFLLIFGASENDFGRNGDLAPFNDILDSDQRNDQKGAVSFLPAYPIQKVQVVVDITNAHYQKYYKSRNLKDLAHEHPLPNTFPVVEQGSAFAFLAVLNGVRPDRSLLNDARRWLETALTIHGIGAKTGAGYGWFQPAPELEREIEEEAAREAERDRKAREEQEAKEEAARREAERLEQLSPEEREKEKLLALDEESFAAFAKALNEKSPDQQRAFIDLLRENKEKRQRWKTWRKRKPEVADTIESVRKNLNLPELP